MNKLKQLKEAIKSTPPDRLAKIEYQSHFMQIIGVATVCAILIFKGYWWIIFAFVFSLGVSLSQGIGAYQKYHAIIDILGKKKYNPDKDKSPSRRRDYIINHVFGRWIKWISLFASTFIAYSIIPYNNWYMKILFVLSIFFIHIIIYFFIIYFFANLIYRRNKK